MAAMTITVFGMPAPQGSKRFLGVRGGKGVLVESSKAVKPWREAVKWAAIERVKWAREANQGVMDGPIVVQMTFSMPRPKSAPKSVTRPFRKPDLSKLIRSTEDALTDAGVWSDDARVVSCDACKVFAGSDSPNALHAPGAVIRVMELPA